LLVSWAGSPRRWQSHHHVWLCRSQQIEWRGEEPNPKTRMAGGDTVAKTNGVRMERSPKSEWRWEAQHSVLGWGARGRAKFEWQEGAVKPQSLSGVGREPCAVGGDSSSKGVEHPCSSSSSSDPHHRITITVRGWISRLGCRVALHIHLCTLPLLCKGQTERMVASADCALVSMSSAKCAVPKNSTRASALVLDHFFHSGFRPNPR